MNRSSYIYVKRIEVLNYSRKYNWKLKVLAQRVFVRLCARSRKSLSEDILRKNRFETNFWVNITVTFELRASHSKCNCSNICFKIGRGKCFCHFLKPSSYHGNGWIWRNKKDEINVKFHDYGTILMPYFPLCFKQFLKHYLIMVLEKKLNKTVRGCVHLFIVSWLRPKYIENVVGIENLA